MSKHKKAYIKLYERDLQHLTEELKAIPEELIWKSHPGVINSCGVLVQHIAGNLKYYIGTVLGKTGYERKREVEFSNTGISRRDLIQQLVEAETVVTETLQKLNEEDLGKSYPAKFPFDATSDEALMHLYGHLAYHRGQVNYLRKIITKKG